MISKNQIKQVRLLEQKKHRREQGLFVAEGPKVVHDLLAAGFLPHSVFATAEWKADNAASLPLTTVTDDELRRLSFLQHPQQVLALFHSRENGQSHIELNGKPPITKGLILALDGIQDPGNLGTIIRLADWFAIDTIVCSATTADAWSPKVVQATMGSIARVNIYYTDLQAWLANCPLPICGTLLDGENIFTSELPQAAVIVMGNEANGISDATRQLLTHRLLIPSFHPGPESLNVAVATAIVCSEFRRRGPMPTLT